MTEAQLDEFATWLKVQTEMEAKAYASRVASEFWLARLTKLTVYQLVALKLEEILNRPSFNCRVCGSPGGQDRLCDECREAAEEFIE